MNRKSLIKLFSLMVCLMCPLGAMAAYEAYVEYTPSSSKLTFYYDTQRSSRTGTTYDLNTGTNLPGWYSNRANVTQVQFHSSFASADPKTTRNWFYMFTNLVTITGMQYLDTWQVQDMSHMFDGCNKLENIDVSRFKTDKVKDMSYMFFDCQKVDSLATSHFNTSSVKNMEAMFQGCSALTTINLADFSTSSVTNMKNMFRLCSNLVTIKVTDYWNTDSVTESSNMFLSCNKLVGCNGTRYNASHVDKSYAHTDGGTSDPGYLSEAYEPYAALIDYWPDTRPATLTFYCDSHRASRTGQTYSLNKGSDSPLWHEVGQGSIVEEVYFDSSFARFYPTTTYRWFYEMFRLYSITGLEYLNTSRVTNMEEMFGFCNELTSLDLSHFNTANVTNMKGMFELCNNLNTITVSGIWNTGAVTSSEEMFAGCFSLVGEQGTTYNANHTDKAYAHVDGGPSNPGYLTAHQEDPVAYACYTSSNTMLTFYYDDQFYTRPGNCFMLNDDTMYPIWYFVDDIRYSVTHVVFDPSFAAARPTSTAAWFALENLETITGINYLNTSEVTNMQKMFENCTKLMAVDLSYFNTAKVTDMTQMFENCASLTTLDLTSFNTNKVKHMYQMFHDCSNLRTIYVGGTWSTSAVVTSGNMFGGCSSLVGGQGTTYDPANIGAEYAHTDGGVSNPGYFTDPNARVAYACYTPANTTLTFYYDNQRNSRTGTTYFLNENSILPGWYMGNISPVTHVVFDPSFANARPTSTFCWFYRMRNLESITNLSYLNTSMVKDMEGMFSDCRQLTSLDLSNFNTTMLNDMTSMFENCYCLKTLDLTSFDTGNVERMSYLFSSCSELKTIYVGSGWNTASVTEYDDMFYDCTSLVGGMGTVYDEEYIYIDYAHIDGGPDNPGYFTDPNVPAAYACYTPSNTTLTFYYDTQRRTHTGTTYGLNTGDNNPDWNDIASDVTLAVFDPSFASARPTSTFCWFYYMENLESITGIEHLNTSEVTKMQLMFAGCSALSSLDVSGFNTDNVTDMSGLFTLCSGLDSIDVSGFNTASVNDMTYMFTGCTELKTLDLSNWNTSNVINMFDMFAGCTGLKTIYVGDEWDTGSVVVYSDEGMFYNCTSLVGGMGTAYDPDHVDLTYAHIDGGPSNPGYFTGVNKSRPYAVYTPDNTTLTFYYNDQQGTRAAGTVYELNSGTNLPDWATDYTNLSVSRVVFDPSFADARPTTTRGWFYCMEQLQTVTGIEYLNTSEVTDMAAMFIECSGLTSLDLSHFDTGNLVEIFNMFYGCTGLRSVDVSSFNTSKVIDMRGLFRNCRNLTSLDLSSFSTSKVENMTYMFSGCSNLSTIYVGDGWSTASLYYSDGMFEGCTSLIGGMGTAYDPNHTDGTYANVDGGSSAPSYFTESPTFMLGDVNGDGFVNVTDVTYLNNLLTNGDPSVADYPSADIDGNGVINITDVTILINQVLMAKKALRLES